MSAATIAPHNYLQNGTLSNLTTVLILETAQRCVYSEILKLEIKLLVLPDFNLSQKVQRMSPITKIKNLGITYALQIIVIEQCI
jgi:hypothetical protein